MTMLAPGDYLHNRGYVSHQCSARSRAFPFQQQGGQDGLF
jgi:hypothetical protein